jgi:RimJ/RimL family protein N-acetyltransferase
MNGLLLRDFSPQDFDALLVMRNDPDLQHLLLAHPGVQSEKDVWSWIERRRAEQGGMFRIVSVDGACAGFVQIVGVHRLDRWAYLGVCIAEKYRGVGIGRQVIELALEGACHELKLRKIIVEVRSDNVPALHLYRRLGFRDVGVMLAHYSGRGQPDDVAILEFLFSDAD